MQQEIELVEDIEGQRKQQHMVFNPSTDCVLHGEHEFTQIHSLLLCSLFSMLNTMTLCSLLSLFNTIDPCSLFPLFNNSFTIPFLLTVLPLQQGLPNFTFWSHKLSAHPCCSLKSQSHL